MIASVRLAVIIVTAASFALAAQTGGQAAAAGSTPPTPASSQSQLGQKQVSSLPLEQRDSSHLLLLSAGTTTAEGGTGNRTQQYSIHGQRGAASVFAIDGSNASDPEQGGATIADFNVDAIADMQTLSGVMPASIGEGAAGYTNLVTKHGTAQFHGDVFEFLRNSVLDARNFFDRQTEANPQRIPPFRRNEFGFTLGGPLFPGAGGSHETTFFMEYQGLRQMLGTTQVLSVPTAAERQGIDTTAFPGDTLFVPVSPDMQAIVDRYPLPNDPTGTYGLRTFATSSNVSTVSDQGSIRLDRQLSPSTQVFGRLTAENVIGPLTNPDQTAIDPSFAQTFTNRYRSVALRFLHDFTSHLSGVSEIGFIRATPVYSNVNHTQPALDFDDHQFENFNSTAGAQSGTWGNLFDLQQTMAWAHGRHNVLFGADIRLNRDTSFSVRDANRSYGFGGSPTYSPVTIVSASGNHDVHPGEVLPDTLSSLLTATPYAFSHTVGGIGFPQGARVGEAAVHREAYDFFFLDNWHASPRLSINYGVRYEVDPPLREPHHQTSSPIFLLPGGPQVPWSTPGAEEIWLVNPQPAWPTQWDQIAPRLALAWSMRPSLIVHAAAGITTQLAIPLSDVALMSGFPFSVSLHANVAPGAPIPFQPSVFQFQPPQAYTPSGQRVNAGVSTATPANTPVDVARYENDLAGVLPNHQVRPLQLSGQSRDFRQGYLGTYSTGIEYAGRQLSLSASYIGIAGVKLMGTVHPNGYGGASPGFAPFTQFDSNGNFQSGFGVETLITNPYHSSYNAFELVARESHPGWGLNLSASYTFSKSLDNSNPRGPDPIDWNLEKAVSDFDVPQILSFSLSQQLRFTQGLGPGWLQAALENWSIQALGHFTSGSPFTVNSGVVQTGFGQTYGDRPDQIAAPVLTTSRTVREDYFGRGSGNASFFHIPTQVPGGSGPNQGRLGTLGRNTFRGPGTHGIDLALVKQAYWRPNDASSVLEFRAEFYNVMNMVNFANPNNTVIGSGFGLINKTSQSAGNARQIQLSLKLSF